MFARQALPSEDLLYGRYKFKPAIVLEYVPWMNLSGRVQTGLQKQAHSIMLLV
jgi:hypothetical protein